MIELLQKTFCDTRAKILIFPTPTVCRNFYLELLRWPSSYRDYFSCENPGVAELACGWKPWTYARKQEWRLSSMTEPFARKLAKAVRECLELKGSVRNGKILPTESSTFEARHPGERMLSAPVRAFSYAHAAKASCSTDDSTCAAVFKFGLTSGGNPYDKKIVLMDEAHNLLRVHDGRFNRLRQSLGSACGTMVQGFTATPIVSDPGDGLKLLASLRSLDEPAVVMSCSARDCSLYPKTVPAGICEGHVLQDLLLATRWVDKVPLVSLACSQSVPEEAKMWLAAGCIGQVLHGASVMRVSECVGIYLVASC